MITTANITGMVLPLVGYWIKNVNGGAVPPHIYYFRDGVSEGQYQHVLQQEVADMKAAFKEKNPNWDVSLLTLSINVWIVANVPSRNLWWWSRLNVTTSDSSLNPVIGLPPTETETPCRELLLNMMSPILLRMTSVGLTPINGRFIY